MAKTSTQQVPDELRPLFQKSVEQRDRYFLGVAQGHKRLPSDRQRKELKRVANINSPQVGRGSMFKFFSPMWRELTDEQKQVWRDASVNSSLSGWQLFISDNAARARASLEFGIPPDELWQVRTGRIEIDDPDGVVLLAQEHPLNYVVTQKMRGMAWKEEIVAVQENFGLPLEIQIRYKSNLVPVGGGSYTPPLGNAVDFSLLEYTPPTGSADFSFSSPVESVARFYARVVTSYQGKDRVRDLVINFDPNTDWELLTAELSTTYGYIISYTLFLEIRGYTGEILFDNIRAIHSGQNWARDPKCDNVSRQFTKGFSQVMPFWTPLDFGPGVSFASYYPPAL